MNSNNSSPSRNSDARSQASSRNSGVSGSQASVRSSQSRTQTPKSKTQQNKQPEYIAELKKQKEQYDVSKMNDLKTEELRNLKKVAIDLYLYDISGKAQKIINTRNKDNFDQVIQAEQEWLAQGIYQVLGNYDSNVIEINQEYDQKELEIREKANSVFENMKQRHISEITDLKFQQKIDEMAEENRKSNNSYGEVISQLTQSKRLASADNVKEAVALKNQALQLSAELSNENLKTIKSKYQLLLNQLKSRQLEELNNFQEYLATSLNQNQCNRNADLQNQEKLVSVALQSNLQKALYDASKAVKSKDLIPEILTILTKFVDTTVKEYKTEQENEQKNSQKSNRSSSNNSTINE